MKSKCTVGERRRVTRWEHEAVLAKVEKRLASQPEKMRDRSQTVEHPFGTLKHWMGATHFYMITLEHVSTEMSLHVLAYNMKRAMNILGMKALIEGVIAAFLVGCDRVIGIRGRIGVSVVVCTLGFSKS